MKTTHIKLEITMPSLFGSRIHEYSICLRVVTHSYILEVAVRIALNDYRSDNNIVKKLKYAGFSAHITASSCNSKRE